LKDEEAMENTDREIWRKVKDDCFSPSIHITHNNSIGMNIGGHVCVMPIETWHKIGIKYLDALHAPN